MNCDKTISPNSLHTHNNSPRYKTRNSSIPLLSPRSNTRYPLSSGLILLTWQKLAPISVLYQILPSINLDLILTLSILSIIIGGWGGLNQTQLRKIIAYSSIAHIGWITAILPYNPTIILLNLIIYITMTSTIFLLFIANSTTTTLSLSLTWNKIPIITT